MKNVINIIKERKFKYICFFWTIISIQYIIGGNLQTRGYSVNGTLDFLVNLFKIIIFSIIFITLHYCVLELIKRIKEKSNKEEIKTEGNIYKNKKIKWLIYFLIIIICWIPTLLAFYPCCTEYDGMYQIRDYYFYNRLNHHPIMVTKLYTLFYSIGVKLNSETLGMLLFSITQMIFMATIFSFCTKFIEEETEKKWVRNFSLMFYALYPYNQLFAITTTKDVILAGIMLIFIIYLYKMIKEKYKIADYIFIILIGIIMLFSRNNSKYTLIVSLPFIILILLKHRKNLFKVLIVFLIIITSYKNLNNLLYKINNRIIIKDGQEIKQEAYTDEGNLRSGIFSQAVGKISRDNEEKLTEYEKEKINYYFTDYKKIASKYEENIADTSSKCVNMLNINKNRKEFFEFMFELFKNYPITCIDSFLNTTRGYWYINDKSFSKIQVYGHPGAFELYDIQIRREQKHRINHDSKLPKLRNLYTNLYRENMYQNVPILYILFQPGIYFYITLAFLLYSIYKKEKSRLVIAIFLFTFYASCYVCNCSIIRYMYPIIVSTPLMLGLVAKKEQENE